MMSTKALSILIFVTGYCLSPVAADDGIQVIPGVPTMAPSTMTTMGSSDAPSVVSAGGETPAPSFDPDQRVLYDATIDITKLGVELRCTEMNARCLIEGDFNGMSDDLVDGVWSNEDDPEGNFLRLSGCVSEFCSALCDPVCSCVVGDPSFDAGPPCSMTTDAPTFAPTVFETFSPTITASPVAAAEPAAPSGTSHAYLTRDARGVSALLVMGVLLVCSI